MFSINYFYNKFQREYLSYKSDNKTLYINPEGTSSECPVCGGKLKHPIWKISECDNCGATFGRDRLSSLSIAVRGLHLCGTPFIVSGSTSWDLMKNNYLYHPDQATIENSSDCKKEVHNISKMVFLNVWNGVEMLCTIGYGWEGKEYYAKWFGALGSDNLNSHGEIP